MAVPALIAAIARYMASGYTRKEAKKLAKKKLGNKLNPKSERGIRKAFDDSEKAIAAKKRKKGSTGRKLKKALGIKPKNKKATPKQKAKWAKEEHAENVRKNVAAHKRNEKIAEARRKGLGN